MNEVLHTENLSIVYKGKALLPDIKVSLCEGDIVALARHLFMNARISFSCIERNSYS